MHFWGLGKKMMLGRMRKKNVASLERLMNDYKELGWKIIACEMTMDIMGLKRADLVEAYIDEYGAVGTYIKEARDSTITLFI